MRKGLGREGTLDRIRKELSGRLIDLRQRKRRSRYLGLGRYQCMCNLGNLFRKLERRGGGIDSTTFIIRNLALMEEGEMGRGYGFA